MAVDQMRRYGDKTEHQTVWPPLFRIIPQQEKICVRNSENFFHLHLISDSTGETLETVARAATAQYDQMHAIEHTHAMVQTAKQIDKVAEALEEEPGLVLYTLVDQALAARLEKACRDLGVPCASVLEPVLQLMQSYLGAVGERRIGAQHVRPGRMRDCGPGHGEPPECPRTG